MMELPKKIQDQLDLLDEKVGKNYQEKNHRKIIELELQKWDLLPDPKEKWDESFHIAESLVDEYTILKNWTETQKWIEIFFRCDLERFDDDERAFIAGKSYYEFEEYEMAYQQFEIAFLESQGRTFQGEDPKYLAFYRNPEKKKKISDELSSSNEYSNEKVGELSEEEYETIEKFLEQGDSFAEKGILNKALKKYNEALNCIPLEKIDYEISLHAYTALGDCFFNLKDYESSNYHYNQALMCPDGIDNGYVWLGAGQSYFELGHNDKAKDALMRAYMLEGEEIFDDSDPKYFNLIKKII